MDKWNDERLMNSGLPVIGSITLGWLAGLLEGEGCFYIHGHLAAIRLNMTDRDVVARAAELWGTNVRTEQRTKTNHRPLHYKPLHCTSIAGPPAIQWMLRLRHLMGSRRRSKIEQVIREWSEIHKSRVSTSKGKNRPFLSDFFGVNFDELSLELEVKNKEKMAARARRRNLLRSPENVEGIARERREQQRSYYWRNRAQVIERRRNRLAGAPVLTREERSRKVAARWAEMTAGERSAATATMRAARWPCE
jgi:hypothetical protein